MTVDRLVCGVDEAGRGCLAGPLYASAVILDPREEMLPLDDSKKLSPPRRSSLAAQICSRALAYGIGIASVREIDERGIEWANRIAFSRAVRDLLRRSPFLHRDHLLVQIDRNRKALRLGLEQVTIVGGDRTVPAISAASILAKTTRDHWVIQNMHARYPHYGFDAHKGYATRRHVEAIRRWGPTPYHRRSFSIPSFSSDLREGGPDA